MVMVTVPLVSTQEAMDEISRCLPNEVGRWFLIIAV